MEEKLTDSSEQPHLADKAIKASGQETLGHMTEETLGHVTAETPGHVTAETMGHVTEETPGHVIEETPGHVTAETTGHVTEETPGHVTEETSHHVTEETTEKSSDLIKQEYSDAGEQDDFLLPSADSLTFDDLDTSSQRTADDQLTTDVSYADALTDVDLTPSPDQSVRIRLPSASSTGNFPSKQPVVLLEKCTISLEQDSNVYEVKAEILETTSCSVAAAKPESMEFVADSESLSDLTQANARRIQLGLRLKAQETTSQIEGAGPVEVVSRATAYRCWECGCYRSSLLILIDHLKISHGMVYTTEDLGYMILRCAKCDHPFLSYSGLSKHCKSVHKVNSKAVMAYRGRVIGEEKKSGERKKGRQSSDKRISDKAKQSEAVSGSTTDKTEKVTRRQSDDIQHSETQQTVTYSCTTKSGALVIPCKECGKMITKVNMSRHLRDKHLRGRNAKPLCTKCGIRLPSKKLLIRHKQDYHGRANQQSGSVHCCRYCLINYEKLSFYQTHMKRYHKPSLSATVSTEPGSAQSECKRASPSSCGQCGVVLSSQQLLARHVLQNHIRQKTDWGKYKCHQCLLSYRYPYLLAHHVQSYHSVEAKSADSQSPTARQSALNNSAQPTPSASCANDDAGTGTNPAAYDCSSEAESGWEYVITDSGNSSSSSDESSDEDETKLAERKRKRSSADSDSSQGGCKRQKPESVNQAAGESEVGRSLPTTAEDSTKARQSGVVYPVIRLYRGDVGTTTTELLVPAMTAAGSTVTYKRIPGWERGDPDDLHNCLQTMNWRRLAYLSEPLASQQAAVALYKNLISDQPPEGAIDQSKLFLLSVVDDDVSRCELDDSMSSAGCDDSAICTGCGNLASGLADMIKHSSTNCSRPQAFLPCVYNTSSSACYLQLHSLSTTKPLSTSSKTTARKSRVPALTDSPVQPVRESPVGTPLIEVLTVEEADIEQHSTSSADLTHSRQSPVTVDLPLPHSQLSAVGSRPSNRHPSLGGADTLPYRCQFCSQYRFTLREMYDQHFKAHHFSCPLCEVSLENRTARNEHLSDVHGSATCLACDRIGDDDDIQQHILNEHVNARGMFKCTQCDQTSAASAEQIIKHLEKHTKPRSDLCCLCKASIGSHCEESVFLHYLQHMEFPTRYKCLACLESYLEPWALRRHLQAAHPNSCNVCLNARRSKEAFKAVHPWPCRDDGGIHKDVNRCVRYEKTCQVCWRQMSAEELRRHCDSEHSTMEHSCTRCGQRFEYYHQLGFHLHKHKRHDKASFNVCMTCLRVVRTTATQSKENVPHTGNITLLSSCSGLSCGQNLEERKGRQPNTDLDEELPATNGDEETTSTATGLPAGKKRTMSASVTSSDSDEEQGLVIYDPSPNKELSALDMTSPAQVDQSTYLQPQLAECVPSPAEEKCVPPEGRPSQNSAPSTTEITTTAAKKFRCQLCQFSSPFSSALSKHCYKKHGVIQSAE